MCEPEVLHLKDMTRKKRERKGKRKMHKKYKTQITPSIKMGTRIELPATSSRAGMPLSKALDPKLLPWSAQRKADQTVVVLGSCQVRMYVTM